jgi:hypothetical protein
MHRHRGRIRHWEGNRHPFRSRGWPRRIADVHEAAATPIATPRADQAVPLPRARYLTSVSILNIGRYIEMMITPTIIPTAIIISGSMIDVSVEIAASTSSS